MEERSGGGEVEGLEPPKEGAFPHPEGRGSVKAEVGGGLSPQESSTGEGEGRRWAAGSIRVGRGAAGLILAAPRGHAADALSPCAVVIEDCLLYTSDAADDWLVV